MGFPGKRGPAAWESRCRAEACAGRPPVSYGEISARRCLRPHILGPRSGWESPIAVQRALAFVRARRASSRHGARGRASPCGGRGRAPTMRASGTAPGGYERIKNDADALSSLGFALGDHSGPRSRQSPRCRTALGSRPAANKAIPNYALGPSPSRRPRRRAVIATTGPRRNASMLWCKDD